jgi:hypothetical protein
VGGSPIRVTPVDGRGSLEHFLALPFRIYRDDPVWVPPLTFERLQHLDPKKNPYFASAEMACWLAWRGERCVGRISAQMSHAHLDRHHDATGHFGFLEAEDDAAAFAALFDAAERWLRARGLRRCMGPFSLSINDESGLLIEGFETPPYIMMGHARPFYAARIAEQGYAKSKDLIAYAFDPQAPLPAGANRMLEKLRSLPGISFRKMDMRRFDQELRTVLDIFNDAWAGNWNFLPMSPAEVRHLGTSLKPLLRPEFVVIGDVEGEPAAMTVTLPNVNEAIADLGGRLLPLGWLKLLWRLKVRGTRSARMPLMGIRRRYHGTPRGAALALGVIDAVRRQHCDYGTRSAELSWVLEDNRPTREIIELVGGRHYKTYRIYEKALT